jgi:tetratricopeptide (TPR) repeat protein
VQAARDTRLVILQGATEPERTAVARELALTVGAPDAPPVDLLVPRVEAGWLNEEVAVALAAELRRPSITREDEAGLLDSAGDALRAVRPSFVVLREAEVWLRGSGTRTLHAWLEVAESTGFVVTARSVTSEVPGAVVIDLSDQVVSERGLPWTELDDDDRAWLRLLAAAPTALPAKVLLGALPDQGRGRRLDRLARSGLIELRFSTDELLVELSMGADTIARVGVCSDADWDTLMEATLAAVHPDVLVLGEPPTFRDAEWLERQRPLLRTLTANAAARSLNSAAAQLAVVTLAAMESRGPQQAMFEIADTAVKLAPTAALRAQLEQRRAQAYRRAGAQHLAQACLERGSVGVEALTPSARAQFALTCALAAMPERDSTGLAERARALATTVESAGPLSKAYAANVRSVLAWNLGSGAEAVSEMLGAVVDYGRSRHERRQLLALASLCPQLVTEGRFTEAAQFAAHLETEAIRLGRIEVAAQVLSNRGCASIGLGKLDVAVEQLTRAIEQLTSLGYHHYERWARAHRGFALLLAGAHDDAARDLESFVEMTRLLGGSDWVGVLGGTLAGSSTARAMLAARLHDGGEFARPEFPLYARALARNVMSVMSEGSRDAPLDDAEGDSPPPYFRFEVSLLRRALAMARGESRPPARHVLRTLRVARDGSWFEYEAGARVSVGRSRVLRLVLRGFVAAHARGDVLDIPDIFRLGWPDERAAPDSAANRVHVTLSRLRTLGLRSALQFTDRGWRIDPSLRMILL